MARTNAVLNGTDLGVYTGVSPVLIALATTCTLNVNRDMRDTSNKDSAGWKQVLTGQRSWTVTAECLYNPSSTNGWGATLYAAWKDGTLLTLTIKNGTQDYYWSGTAYITSMSMNAPNEGNVTYSVSFQGTGALTQTDPLA